jgi:uncharacterized membrane protein/predicted DsbA family dithiol-disulfide isomerase
MGKTVSEKNHRSLSVYFYVICCIALIGLADSVYLSISHYRIYTDMTYRSFCAISRAINCDTVSQSPYAILAGAPVPVWGIFGYLFFLSLLVFFRFQREREQGGWTILLLLAVAFCLYSIILALISSFLIHSYCIMCILRYGVNFALLYMAWFVRRRFDSRSTFSDALKSDIKLLMTGKKIAGPVMAVFPVVALLMMFYYPNYWRYEGSDLSSDIPMGLTEEGCPWIGAENPQLEITEFTDYQCFQCRKMHFFLRELIEKYPKKIRLIHRQFPLDSKFNPLVMDDFHIGSGKMALLAEYAKTQGKFWQMNDLLFKMAGKGKFINTRVIGEKTGLDYRSLALSSQIPSLRYALKHDIAIGLKLGIRGTPGYVINGKVYQGLIPAEILEQVLG